jgi:hypothetical protein
MDDFDDKEPGPVRDTGPILFLGLFLLLLAFFILLNALATREEFKTRALINSLTLTFQTPKDAETSKTRFISALAPVPEPEDLMDEVERIWVASIPLVTVERLSNGRTMQVTMPVNELFVGSSAALRADRNDLLVRTATALAHSADGFVNELEFVFGDIGAPGDGLDETLYLRAAAIARELIANGAPPDRVTIGSQRSSRRQLRMRFNIREAEKAYITFENPDR